MIHHFLVPRVRMKLFLKQVTINSMSVMVGPIMALYMLNAVNINII